MASIEQYRREIRHLSRLAEDDLAVLWRQVNSAQTARVLLLDVAPELVELYGSAALSLAADWYDEARESAGVGGRFRAIVAELPSEGRITSLAGWVAGGDFETADGIATALVNAQGGMQRIVANAGRDTITGSSIADPRARGWQRVGAGECEFCQMLISRGAVYSEATAEFAAHDHCNCAAVPAWDD